MSFFSLCSFENSFDVIPFGSQQCVKILNITAAQIANDTCSRKANATCSTYLNFIFATMSSPEGADTETHVQPELTMDVTDSILIPYKFPLNSPNSMNLKYKNNSTNSYFKQKHCERRESTEDGATLFCAKLMKYAKDFLV